MPNAIGTLYTLTTFGESHGAAIGGIVDGMPSGIDIDLDFIQNELNRRRPGQSKITTDRKETDEVEEHRPDRVMTDGKEVVVVDFKFGNEREEYKRQVQRYMEILTHMGHKNVSGYLWYVVKNIVTEVEIDPKA